MLVGCGGECYGPIAVVPIAVVPLQHALGLSKNAEVPGRPPKKSTEACKARCITFFLYRGNTYKVVQQRILTQYIPHGGNPRIPYARFYFLEAFFFKLLIKEKPVQVL